MNTVLEKYGPKNFTKRDIINRAIETIVRVSVQSFLWIFRESIIFRDQC